MRKLGLRERKFLLHSPRGSHWYCCYEDGAAWQCERFHWHGCREWAYIKTPQPVGRVVIRSVESSYTSRVSFFPPVLERVCIWIVEITHTHLFLQGPYLKSRLKKPHPFEMLGSNGPMSASIKLPNSYRIISFPTLRSVIIWNQKITWPLLNGFRVKETQ